MPDVNSIDSLSLKITSSTEEAVKALNSLENALLSVISATEGLKAASSNVDTFAKSMSGLASGLKSAITASKNMTFTQAEAEARELDKTINKVSKSSLNAFGVTNKKAIGDYRKALSDMANEYRRTDDFDVTRITEQAKLLEDNSNFTKKAVDNYGEFKRYIDKLIADGNKVHRAFSFEDLGAGVDVKNAKGILGRLLTTGEASTDFEEWATQLQGAFQNITIVGGTVAETINNIAAAYDEGRGKAIKYADALKLPDSEGGLSGITSFTTAMNDADEVLKKVHEFQKATNVGDENNSVFRSMANSVSELNGVDFERVQALAGAMQPFASIDAGALSLAAKSISQLGDSLGKIALPEGGSNVGEFIKSLHTPLKMFVGLELPDFKPLLTLQKALSGFNEESYTIAATNLSAMAPTIKAFADQMREIKTDGIEPLNNLIKSVTKFGHANMNKAIANIPTLASALKGLVDELNQLPEVSDKTLRLVEALGTLRTLNVGKAFDSAGKGADNYGKSAHKARGHTNGLLGVFMKARALLWGLRRAFDAVKGSIDLASDLIEVQNVVDVTFGNYQSHLEEIAKNSIETYGTSELTFKSVASQFQAMGSAMGIGNSQIREATENLKGMGVAYGETTGQMGDMATTLTELSADMASFYNKDIEEVQTAMTSVFTGQTRPLRAFGLDLTQTNIAAWALSQGLNADVQSMTQAEKTMLRYQYVLAHTTAAQNDFIRTSDRLCVA